MSQTLVPQCVTQSSNIVKKGASAFSMWVRQSIRRHTHIYIYMQDVLAHAAGFYRVCLQQVCSAGASLTVVVNGTLARNTKPCSCSVLPQASAAGLPGVVLVGKRKLLKL